MNELKLRWQALGERERQLMLGAAAFIALVLFFLIAIEPAWKTREQLQRTLPTLRADAVQLEQASVQAQSLRAQAQAVIPAAELGEALRMSLAQSNVSAEVKPLANDALEVQVNNADAAALLMWLETTQRALRLTLTASTLERTETRGKVNGRLTLAASRPREN